MNCNRIPSRAALLIALLALVSGCVGEGKGPDPLRARHLGKVYAERDTQEAFAIAATHFESAIAADPGNALDQLNLAKCRVFTDRNFEQALAAVEKAEQLYGADTPLELHYVAGLCLVRLERYSDAVQRFAKVTEALPDHTFAWYQRGNAEARGDQLEAAATSFARVLTIDAEHRSATYRAARVARRLKKIDEARRLDAAFQKLPDDKSDKEKCDLTKVMLRPHDRARHEPARVEFSWKDVTGATLGDLATGAGSFRVMRAGKSPDLVLMRLGEAGETVIARRTGAAYAAVRTEKDWSPQCLVADFDNDGEDDVFLPPQVIYRGQKGGGYERTENASLAALHQAEAALPQGLFDIDHDGDLDVIATGPGTAEADQAGGIVFWRNNSDPQSESEEDSQAAGASAATAKELTFTAISAPSVAAWRKPFFGAVTLHDFDQANDLDLAVCGPRGVTAHLNQRDGTFKEVPLVAADPNWRQVLAEDFDNDGAPDLFVSSWAGNWQLLRNEDRQGKAYQLNMQVALAGPAVACAPVIDSCLADIDNDGDVDVILAGKGGFSILRNDKGGQLTEEPLVVVDRVQQVGTADLTGDGSLEVVVAAATGVKVFASSASPRYRSIVLCPDGAKDNDDGVGTIVEVYAGRTFQSRMVGAGGLHLGVGKETLEGTVDGLLLRWPNGILQAVIDNELVIEKDDSCRVPQKSGESASCPFLYCEGAGGWRFVTDILGIAPLGEWTPAGVKGPLDPEEFVRIDGQLLTARDGKLRMTVTEELRETAYVDRLELVAIDHPADRLVFADESTRQPAYGPLELVVIARSDLSTADEVLVQRRGSAVEDVTALVRDADRSFAHPYTDSISQLRGWVAPHEMHVTTAAPAQTMLLQGRVSWYDSGVAYSAHQSGREWGPSPIDRWVDGKRQRLLDDVGLPAGMDRTVLFDLTSDGAVLPAGTRLTLTAQHRLLWDQIRFASQRQKLTLFQGGDAGGSSASMTLEDGAAISYRVLHPAAAKLYPYGYARIEGDEHRHEETYHFSDNAPRDEYGRAPGLSTRYGDVTPLLQKHDDQLVVIVTGDACEVEFPAPEAAPAGMARTYFLRVSGWAKETAYHNQGGPGIAPLPFRGMSHYPPPAHETPTDPEYRKYLEEYQTRPVR